MTIYKASKAMAVVGFLVVFSSLCWIPQQIQAAKGDSRTALFFGTTRFVVKDDSSFGTTIGGSYSLDLGNELWWNSGVAFGFTDGEATDDAGNTQEIQANTNQYHSGLTLYFNSKSAFSPFVGGGLSVLEYTIDYAYEGSEVGETSGVGLGAYSMVGMNINLTRRMTFIPIYQFSAHSIETEDGDPVTIIGGGLQLSLRISF